MFGPGGIELALGNGARPSKYKISITPPTILMSSGFATDKTLNTLICETKIPAMKMNTCDIGMDGRTIQIPYAIDIKNTWSASFYVDDAYIARRFFEYWMLFIDSYSCATVEDPPSSLGDAAIGGLGKGLGGLINKGVSALSNLGSRFGIGNDSLDTYNFSTTAKYESVTSETSDEYPNPIRAGTSNKEKLIGNISQFLQPYNGTIDITQLDYTGTEICTYTLFNAYPIEVGSIGFKDSDTHGISTIEVTFSFTDMRYQKAGGLLENLVSAADKISKGNFF
jgi:hypothetical protein